MARIEASVEDFGTRLAALPRSFWRRRGDASLATLSGGIRLAVLTSPFIVRWAAWLVALLIFLVADVPEVNRRFEPWLLIGTLAQTAFVTFYVPLLRPGVLPLVRRYVDVRENSDVLALGLIDLGLSMIAVYLSGGWGSPYFHFALTALLIPAFFLTFRGVLVLGGAYMAAYVFGLAAFGDGVDGSWLDNNLNSFIGALVTPWLVALVPNYLGSLLRELDAARQDAVDALGDSDLLFRVARGFLEGGRELDEAMPNVAQAALEASRFDAMALLVRDGEAVHAFGAPVGGLPDAARLDDALDVERARSVTPAGLPRGLRDAFGTYAWVGVAPMRSRDGVEGWVVAGMDERPVTLPHEVRVLDAVAGQIALGVRNVRLTQRVAELAAEGERGRIAREIHDGIAQMVYMLSLSLETAVDRVGSDPEEQRQRLKDLTALAKTALWEVRQYIFDLQPLLSGEAGLVGAVEGQVKEFQAVSELPVELTIAGTPWPLPLGTSTALYRMVQEGLGNVFRHARASKVQLALSFRDGHVDLSIADDGIGMGDGDTAGRAGFGMANLRRRVEELRGTIDVHSAPGAGTRLDVSIPVAEETPAQGGTG